MHESTFENQRVLLHRKGFFEFVNLYKLAKFKSLIPQIQKGSKPEGINITEELLKMKY